MQSLNDDDDVDEGLNDFSITCHPKRKKWLANVILIWTELKIRQIRTARIYEELSCNSTKISKKHSENISFLHTFTKNF